MSRTNGTLLQAVRGPIMLMTLGGLLAANNFGYYSFTRTWPVLVIVFGVLKLLEVFRRPLPGGRRFIRREAPNETRLHCRSDTAHRDWWAIPAEQFAAGPVSAIASRYVLALPLCDLGRAEAGLKSCRFVSGGAPLPSSGLSGGEWALAVLLFFIGSGLTFSQKVVNGWPDGIISLRGLEVFGEAYDYPVEASHAAVAAPRIVIENLRGNVRVAAGTGDEIQVTGRKTIRAIERSTADSADKQTPIQIEEERRNVCNPHEPGESHLQRTRLHRSGR